MKKYILSELLDTLSERFDGGYIFERLGDRYISHTYGEYASDVKGFAAYLCELGLCNQKIGIYAENSYAYMVADMAVMAYVGTSVCISKDWKYSDAVRGCEFTDIRALIYSKSKQAEVERLREKLPSIIYIPIESILSLPCKALKNCPVNYDECSKIVFSSGTTGIPKAVMLSQKNMFACSDGLFRRAQLGCDDSCYMFLPLHHTYASVCIFLYSLITGMKIYICSNISKIAEELTMLSPTVFCTVPLVLERIYSAIQTAKISPKEAFGGNLRYLFCGGAAFDPSIRAFFIENGINLLNSYGLSETSALISLDYSGERELLAAGTVIESIDIKISEPDEHGIGEIAVRADNVFLGYYKNPSLTARVFDSDGYFHTGDLGHIENNRLYIKGRKKRIILLSNGENIYPEEIEARLEGFNAISKVKVYESNGRMQTDIFITPDLHSTDIQKIVDEVNAELPTTHKIKRFQIFEDSIGKRLK